MAGNPADPNAVFALLGLASSNDNAQRKPAENALREWERGAAPGFLLSLLAIVEQKGAPLSARLMAAVLAKNTVGSGFAKTIAAPDWHRVSPDEKAAVRAKLEALLFGPAGEEDARIGTHLALLVANIARFDFPQEWPTLLAVMVRAAQWQPQPLPLPPPLQGGGAMAAVPAAPLSTPPAAKRQALLAMKHTLRALLGKQIAVPRRSGSTGVSAALAALRAVHDAAASVFAPLAAEWAGHAAALQAAAPGWEIHAELCAQALAVLRELVLLMPSLSAFEPHAGALLDSILSHLDHGFRLVFPPRAEQVRMSACFLLASSSTTRLTRLPPCVPAAVRAGAAAAAAARAAGDARRAALRHGEVRGAHAQGRAGAGHAAPCGGGGAGGGAAPSGGRRGGGARRGGGGGRRERRPAAGAAAAARRQCDGGRGAVARVGAGGGRRGCEAAAAAACRAGGGGWLDPR